MVGSPCTNKDYCELMENSLRETIRLNEIELIELCDVHEDSCWQNSSTMEYSVSSPVTISNPTMS